MFKYWVGVACRQHVLRGVSGGFCQVCHGKEGPLKRMTEGEWIVYYSPTEVMGEKSSCQKFTAIGQLAARQPYQFQMNESFVPWRRDVTFVDAKEVAIQPLIEQLSFIQDKRRWGFPFRWGCFSIPQKDFQLIARTMGVSL